MPLLVHYLQPPADESQAPSRQQLHYLQPPPEEILARLRPQLAAGIELTSGSHVPEATEILIGGRPSREQLNLPRLKALIIPWAGLPEATAELLPDFPHLSVHNLHHNAIPVAEMALTLLLAAARLIVPADQALRRGDWSLRYVKPSPSLLLAGKKALVLGYGAIGQRLARLLQALEMEVVAVRRRTNAPTADGTATIYPASALPELLPQVHALLVCLPLTPATEGSIGAAELARLPDGAVVVNVGRAAIIQEEALYGALRDGRLRAGLDVWYNYPADAGAREATPPATYPFHGLDNVVLSPHRAGGCAEIEALRLDGLARLLAAAARGEAMPNRIDVAAGY